MPNKRTLQTVSCLCGGDVRVDASSPERRVKCPHCGSIFDFVVTLDKASRSPRLSLVLPRSALKTEGESLALLPTAQGTDEPPAPPAAVPPPKAVTRISKKSAGKAATAVLVPCECGEKFPVEDSGELTSIQSCPSCNRAYHVVFKLDAGSKTAIIVPTKPIVHRGEHLRTILGQPAKELTPSPAANQNTDVSTTDFFGAGKKGRSRATKASRPKPPVEIPPGAQASPCACGEMFIVRRRDVGQILTCGGCGAKYRATESRDPQTLAPTIRMKPV